MSHQSSSPLEHLAAFAMTFLAGMAASAALGAYTRYIRRHAVRTASTKPR
jgi:hypothetical protein